MEAPKTLGDLLGYIRLELAKIWRYINNVQGSYEEWSLSGQVIATGTLTTLINQTLQFARNAPTTNMVTSTGIWTAPEDDEYTISLNVAFTAWVAGSRSIVRITDTSSGRVYGNLDVNAAGGTLGMQGIQITKQLTSGTTLKFEVYQATGGNRTVDTASYISIKQR